MGGHSAGGRNVDGLLLGGGDQLFKGVVGGVGGNQNHFGIEADAGKRLEILQDEVHFLQLGVVYDGAGVGQQGVTIGSRVLYGGLTNSAAAAADVLHDHGVTIEALADGIGHQAGGQVNAAAGVVGNDHSDVLGGKLNGSSALSESAARSRSKSACRGLGAASGKDRDSQNSSASQC